MEPTIDQHLENARKNLLDLSGRNRLLNTPRSTSRSSRLEIVDDLSDEVFRHLVLEKKPMSFLPRPDAGEPVEGTDEAVFLAQPEDDENVDENGVAARHRDDQLQTQLGSEQLQKKLLRLHYDARTFEEEQGVNILYLAIGFLKWLDSDNSNRERHAPLILIPVTLERQSAQSKFRLRWSEEEITTNLSLREKLRVDYGIRLPELPDSEELSPSDYFGQLTDAIAGQEGWSVLKDDIVLWFFSFSKFLMYRDLEPGNWPEHRGVEEHAIVTSLLRDGFEHRAPICGDDENIDRILEPKDLVHVVDADSSQTIAIEDVRRGRNLVIQGPPGTGKSQTITNLIVTAVKEGKKVLFVAEKMAALEVVKRRLENIGLGDICLELHSNKTNKRAVLDELSRCLSLGRPKAAQIQKQADLLKATRDKLNRYVAALHTRIMPAERTPYQIIGELVRLRSNGVSPASFELKDPLRWTAEDYRLRSTLVAELADHVNRIGVPREHPWRGTHVENFLPTDIDRVVSTLPAIISRIDELLTASNNLADVLGLPEARSALDASNLARLARELVNAPPMDRQAIASDVWESNHEDICTLLQHGRDCESLRRELSTLFADYAWSTDVTAIRRELAAHGRSWFRIFSSKYRRAYADFCGILRSAPPTTLKARLECLDRLRRSLELSKALQPQSTLDTIGKSAFGSLWKGEKSDWGALEQINRWVAKCQESKIPGHFRQVHSSCEEWTSAKSLIVQIGENLKPLLTEIQSLFNLLKLDLKEAFGVADIRVLPLTDLRARIESWQQGRDTLPQWLAFNLRRRKLDDVGLSDLGAQLDDGRVYADEACDQLSMAYHESLMREVFRSLPELAEFDGESHEALITRFQQLDEERLELSRQEVALSHFESLPLQHGGIGEIGVLTKEMNKKRRHMPLRMLLSKAGHAVQTVKPVFMMSPVSVAQFLEPGALEFDLLLIDEASQVRPVDALGAIARAKQIVIVGDDRQLPPSQFFSKLAGDDEDDQADDFQTGDVESVLSLCLAQKVPQRMLRWHYRSRHESLIAVSNHEFYDNKLFVVPSPLGHEHGLGLSFHQVDGVFDRGGSATNRIEAAAVADAVLKHVRECPDKTLGVGTFSVAQRDAIMDEVELRRRHHPELEAFFIESQAEPFFVKNLENIQGDERDVILISVGYGKDQSGKMSMNFGPLSYDGGERRLNVLISRARERCEVFSSITDDDIDTNRAKSKGARALKTFLKCARTRNLDTPAPVVGEHDSVLEEEIASALSRQGIEIETQVGDAGFHIDLAVVDPEQPGRYLLGIECDGVSYHSARSARDRDRIRQAVLEDRGWILHRIWSTDWFQRPKEQLDQLIDAIEDARAEWARRDQGHASKAVNETDVQSIERHEVDENDGPGMVAVDRVPYRQADFSVDRRIPVHEVRSQDLAKIVTMIAEIEGPVHQDEIARRVASLWGLDRTGRRISEAVEIALSQAIVAGHLKREDMFISPIDANEVLIRDRSHVTSRNVKKAEYLPTAEIRAAVKAVVETHVGVTEQEVLKTVASLLGVPVGSSTIRELISSAVYECTRDGTIMARNDKLYCS